MHASNWDPVILEYFPGVHREHAVFAMLPFGVNEPGGQTEHENIVVSFLKNPG